MGTLRFLCDRSSSAYRAFPTTEQPHVLRRLVFHRCTTITFIHCRRTVVKHFLLMGRSVMGSGLRRIRAAPIERPEPTPLGGARAGGSSEPPPGFPGPRPKAARLLPGFRCIEGDWPLAL